VARRHDATGAAEPEAKPADEWGWTEDDPGDPGDPGDPREDGG
jgi:hypothetical protein